MIKASVSRKRTSKCLSFRHKSFLGWLGSSCAVILFTTSLSHASEDQLNLQYDFMGGGLHVLSAKFDLKFDEKTYLVKAHLKTKGLANFFAKSVSYLGARGKIIARKVHPLEFQSRVENSKGHKTAHVVWQAKNQQKVDVAPTPGKFRTDAVDRILKPAFPDPLSALLTIAFSTDKLCHNKIRSFDGRKVFDFNLEYIGEDILRKGQAGSYVGVAHKCRFTNIPLAGYSRSKMKKYRSKPTPAYTIWFAPVNSALTRKTLYVPVKAAGSINWASVKMVITKGTLNGQLFTAAK